MPHRRALRLAGWVLAANALGVLAAVSLGGSVGAAARHVALLCGFDAV